MLRPNALVALRVVAIWILALLMWLVAWGLSWITASEIGRLPQPGQGLWVAIALALPLVPWVVALIWGARKARKRTRALGGLQSAAIALGAASLVVSMLVIPKPA